MGLKYCHCESGSQVILSATRSNLYNIMTARPPAFFIFNRRKNKMATKINKGVKLLFLLLMLFSLIGCSSGNIGTIGADIDELEIQAIADSIKTAIENKDVDMFMSNISLDYSDSYGGTYDTIYAMAQDMVDEIEAAEEMAGSYGVNLSVNVSISNLIIVDTIASSDLKITINAKLLFLTVYSYSMDFEVNFQKEDTGWKIISMLEKS